MEEPRRLGNYELIELVGHGGQGTVYKAIDTSLQRIVAVKVFFKGKGADNRQQLASFIYEARLASALDHPNICTVYSLVDSGPETYMVMEYVEGKNLFELAYGRPLAISSALRIVLQVVEALSVAHERGIIHRDIKPRNVMVTPSGQVRVLDFGLAKLLERPDGSYEVEDGEVTGIDSPVDIYESIGENLYVTPPGLRQGTPSTSAPEMAKGEPTDARSDIFSAGVILYLLLTGKYPFIARTKKEVLAKVISEDPVPVSIARESGGSPSLELIALVNRSLRKDPAERFQSMKEMRDALIEVLREADTESESTVPVFDASGRIYFASGNRRWWQQVIVLSVAGAVAAATLLLFWLALS